MYVNMYAYIYALYISLIIRFQFIIKLINALMSFSFARFPC